MRCHWIPRAFAISFGVVLVVGAPILASNAFAQGGTWTSRAPMPTPRYAHAAVEINGRIHVVGGTSQQSCTFLATHDVYDPLTDTWTGAAPMSTPRVHPGAVLLNGLLYVVGGTERCSSDLASMEAYDPSTNTWAAKAPMSTPRTDFGIAVLNGLIYVVGGNYPSGVGNFLPTVEAYDPATDSWTPKPSMPRELTAMAIGVFNGILYVAGGARHDAPTAEVYAFDPATDTWTPKTSMSVARGFVASTVVDGLLYVLAGVSVSGHESMVEIYDPAADRWATGTSLPAPRGELAAVAVNGQVYAIGGFVGSDVVTITADNLVLVDGPLTTASLSPPPNGNGWNNGDVIVTLTATAPVGIASIVYTLAGAQIDHATVAGNTTSFTISAEGTTTVTYHAVDLAGHVEPDHTLTLRIDRTPPVLSAISDQTVEATSPGGAFFTVAPSATDTGGSGVVSATASPSGPFFPLGTTIVTLNALDAAGNGAVPLTFTVTVQDTTSPTLFVPPDITAEASGPSGAFVSFFVSAFDAATSAPVVSCTHSSGTFPVGTTTVACTATDAAGNEARISFDVVVRDTQPPFVSTPFGITREATGPDGAAVTFSASANDAVDGALTVSCSPPSGSMFPIASTLVNCSATDSHGNTGSRTFTVIVRDTMAPTFGPVINVEAAATSEAGAVVNYALPVATDVVDGPIVATCDPAPGSTFPIGSTQVRCTARDTRGNTRSLSFTVRVEPVLLSLEVEPRMAEIVPGATYRFVGIGRFSDGSTQTTEGDGGSGGDPGGGSGGGGGGGSGPPPSLWSIEFTPFLDPSPCGLSGSGGFASQSFSADATGAVDTVWSLGTPAIHVVGTLTPESQFTATLTCTNGNPATGSITATWAGPTATRFTGTYSLASGAGSVVIKGWSSKASLPQALFALGAAEAGGKLYAIGGAGSNQVFGVNQVYDPSTNAWATAAPMPTRREGMGVASLGGKIYAVGGNAGGVPLRTVEVYDPATNSWTPAADLLTARAHFALVAAGGMLYAIGGETAPASSGGVTLTSVEQFDPETNSWTPRASLPAGRAFLAAGALNGGTLIVAAGGVASDDPGAPRTTLLYDVSLDRWRTGAPMLVGMSLGGGAVVGNAFYTFGGFGPCPSGQVFIPGVNGNPDGWALLAPMPTHRSEFGMAAIGDVIYAAGGLATGVPDSSVATFESYSATPAGHLTIQQPSGEGGDSCGGGGSGGGGGGDEGPTWRVLDETIASIDRNGVVTGLAPGETTVVIEFGDVSCLTTNTCATLRVRDVTPPTITEAAPSLAVLWPPNHKMVAITVSAHAVDAVDPSPVCTIASVRSNEPIDGLGDGDTAPDWAITGPLALSLRAERAGKGSGRVYSIEISCSDRAGNTATTSVGVAVPHDRSR